MAAAAAAAAVLLVLVVVVAAGGGGGGRGCCELPRERLHRLGRLAKQNAKHNWVAVSLAESATKEWLAGRGRTRWGWSRVFVGKESRESGYDTFRSYR